VALARRAASEADPDLAMQLLFGASRRVWWRDPGDEVRRDIVRAAEAVPLPDGDPRVLAVLALAESLGSSPTVMASLARWPADAGGRPDLAGLLGIAAFCVGDHERAEGYLSTAVVELRAQGRLSLLAEVLALRSWAELNLGVFDAARSADEAMRLGDETGQAVWGATARIAVAVADAVGGGSDSVHRLLAEAEQTAMSTPNASSSLLSAVQLARGVAELGVDHPEQAYAELRRVFVPTDPAYQQIQQFWALGYLADAAVPTGRRDEAIALVDSLAGVARRRGVRQSRPGGRRIRRRALPGRPRRRCEPLPVAPGAPPAGPRRVAAPAAPGHGVEGPAPRCPRDVHRAAGTRLGRPGRPRAEGHR